MPRAVPLATAGHEKRKGDTKGGALKDRRASGGASTGAHTHNEEEDDDGKGNKQKTSEKRKLQNRQAQRNFRERKEKVSCPSSPAAPRASQGTRGSCVELGAADYGAGNRERRPQAATRAIAERE
ncbi:hypothetical protein BCR35DRAFT_125553 [Leucosporidium creatinivorum]|uniref:BZIP domain-containing protein n=1 Tax=Leucosporidium creatinivorum TaxID=106004 RepID=A0A1Y2EWZ1_9BASI|nr:hypothetical protein BCR35DRAFT_125553 [Leucosporidium creatinivorum]